MTPKEHNNNGVNHNGADVETEESGQVQVNFRCDKSMHKWLNDRTFHGGEGQGTVLRLMIRQAMSLGISPVRHPVIPVPAEAP